MWSFISSGVDHFHGHFVFEAPLSNYFNLLILYLSYFGDRGVLVFQICKKKIQGYLHFYIHLENSFPDLPTYFMYYYYFWQKKFCVWQS